MTEIEALIADLGKATGPNRQLDLRISHALGYRRDQAAEVDASAQAWLTPSGEKVASIPFFTRSLDNAYRLASVAAPSDDWGCGWETGLASAKLGDDMPCEASTPAIALCMAALRRISLSTI